MRRRQHDPHRHHRYCSTTRHAATRSSSLRQQCYQLLAHARARGFGLFPTLVSGVHPAPGFPVVGGRERRHTETPDESEVRWTDAYVCGGRWPDGAARALASRRGGVGAWRAGQSVRSVGLGARPGSRREPAHMGARPRGAAAPDRRRRRLVAPGPGLIGGGIRPVRFDSDLIPPRAKRQGRAESRGDTPSERIGRRARTPAARRHGWHTGAIGTASSLRHATRRRGRTHVTVVRCCCACTVVAHTTDCRPRAAGPRTGRNHQRVVRASTRRRAGPCLGVPTRRHVLASGLACFLLISHAYHQYVDRHRRSTTDRSTR